MKCGQSDERNRQFQETYSEDEYFRRLVPNPRPVILDVGAHRGESLSFFMRIFPDATVYSFEPDPRNYPILAEEAVKHPSCFTFPLAVANRTGEIDFFMQDLTHIGGTRPINHDSRDSLGYAARAPNQRVSVACTTLADFVARERIGAIDLLKIDVQGAETDVLEGADGALDRVQTVSVECTFFDLYGEPKGLLDVERLMQAHGLMLFDISKVSKNPKNWRADWAELVYKRTT